MKRCLITLWNNDCKREEGITHEFWKEKVVFFGSEFEKEKVGETSHTLLITKENGENSPKNVTTRINTSQPGEKQAPFPEQGPQCNQEVQYEGSVGQNFTQAQNPNFVRQFSISYFVKPRSPYRPRRNRFYNKGRRPNKKWNNNGYQGFQQGGLFDQNYESSQWFPPGFMPPPIQQRSEF